MQSILKKFPENEFRKVGLCMEKFDDSQLKIYYNAGRCTLNEFVCQRFAAREFFTAKNNKLLDLVAITKRLVDCILALHQKGVYQSDIKPDNISFLYDIETDQHILYLIDFGSASTDYKKVLGCTKLYFYNESTRNDESFLKKTLQFKAPADRAKAELYAVSIIFLEIALLQQLLLSQPATQITEDQIKLLRSSQVHPKIKAAKANKEVRQQTFALLEKDFGKELVRLIQQLFEEQYEIDQLQKDLKKVLVSCPGGSGLADMLGLVGQNEIINKITQRKIEKQVNQLDSLEKLNSYVSQLIQDDQCTIQQKNCLMEKIEAKCNAQKFANQFAAFSKVQQQNFLFNVYYICNTLADYHKASLYCMRLIAFTMNEENYQQLTTHLNNMAKIYYQTNKFQECLALQNLILQVDELQFGTEHQNTSTNLANLSSTLISLG